MDAEQTYDWSDSISTNEDDFSVTSLSRNLLEVSLSSTVVMQVTLTASKDNGFYLGLFVTKSDGLSSETSGVIGKSEPKINNA